MSVDSTLLHRGISIECSKPRAVDLWFRFPSPFLSSASLIASYPYYSEADLARAKALCS